MNCKNHRIRTKKGNKYGYCTLYKKEVPVFGCKCESIDQKMYNNWSMNVNKIINLHNKTKNTVQKSIKKRSYKLAKREKERYSIIYQDLSKCCVNGCLTPNYNVQKNEVFDGAYRQLSIKHGMICPLCDNHHKQFHKDRRFAIKYKIQFEEEFLKNHVKEEWLDIFKIDYKYKKK